MNVRIKMLRIGFYYISKEGLEDQVKSPERAVHEALGVKSKVQGKLQKIGDASNM